jgi:hypothetical protein
MYRVSFVQKEEYKEILYQLLEEFIDVYFTPEYFTLTEKGSKEGEAKFLKFETSEGICIYPFLERVIPFHLTEGLILKDITTPYGYGGPLCFPPSGEIIAEFNIALNSFFKEMGYVSEFIRFHPILKNYKYRICPKRYIHKTFGVDLRSDSIENFSFFTDSFLRGLRKARKNNLQFSISEVNKHNLSIFEDLYFQTMDRKRASEYYFFGKEYWKNLLKFKDSTLIADVRLKEQVISSVILLHWKSIYLHYHLGGSLYEYLSLRPNNFLFWNIEKWAKDNGFVLLHLGGGIQEGDNLERFKKSISNVCFDFYVSTNIINSEAYKKLSETAIKIDKDNFSEDFFPAYRSIRSGTIRGDADENYFI